MLINPVAAFFALLQLVFVLSVTAAALKYLFSKRS